MYVNVSSLLSQAKESITSCSSSSDVGTRIVGSRGFEASKYTRRDSMGCPLMVCTYKAAMYCMCIYRQKRHRVANWELSYTYIHTWIIIYLHKLISTKYYALDCTNAVHL